MAVTWDTKNGIAKLATTADTVTGDHFIQWIYVYMKGATAGDDVLVSDTAGNEIFRDVATVENYTRQFVVNRRVSGIVLTTMDTAGGYILVGYGKDRGKFAS